MIQHTNKYARSLIEASLDPLVTISIDGKIMDMNQAAINITGLERDKLTHSNFFKYFTDTQMASEVYQEVFANGSVADYPLTLRHKTGKLTDVLLNGSVYKDENGVVMGVVVVARDVTEQKRITDELVKARDFAELVSSVAQEAKKQAQTATKKAEDAVKSKQQFLSNMSHEIRTPMNAIIGFTKVLLKTELTERQREYLLAIKLSGDALIVLINDILDLAKVDSGKMVFEQIPFRLDLSLSAMMHLFESKILEKNLTQYIEFDEKIPHVLVGDPVRLHQIIMNLLSNAVKFTSRGSIIVKVKLIAEDKDNATIDFSVTDTGMGIDPSKINLIFENFQQASSNTSRLYGGTGLGLAIVKQLVETQGGKIHVQSVVDQGSVFGFNLTFQKTDESVSEIEELELITGITNLKVLVAEDIPLNQLLMKTILDEFGFEGDIAPNGKSAVEKLKKKNYDIVLMDLQMPEMNGFEATNYIRNVLKSNIPIIALTADVTTVDLAKCKSVGMNDYIAKPVDERVLYSKIISLVRKNITINALKKETALINIRTKSIDLEYLNHRTKSNPVLMMEMISLFLEQTPLLINVMKESIEKGDWVSLYAAVHKMLPSFIIMGIDHEHENLARKIQAFANSQKNGDGIQELVLQLERVCIKACDELEEEYETIKNKPIV
jgi:PAS domain S-box-containing protein